MTEKIRLSLLFAIVVAVVWFVGSGSSTNLAKIGDRTDTDRTEQPSKNGSASAPPFGKRPPATREESATDVPMPPPPAERKSALDRVIGDHFRSHPSTERRIVHLRYLESGKTPPPQDDIDRLVRTKERLTRSASDIFNRAAGPLSLEEEWQIGQQVRAELLQESVVDAAQSERIRQLAAPLLAGRQRTKSMPYTFTVLTDDTFNAFSHLGGHVYFYSGLLNRLTETAQLEFVIAHEIAHVELGHCANRSLPALVAENAFGEFAKLPASILQRLTRIDYLSSDEFDADAWAYKWLKKMGRSDQDTLCFFHAMLAMEQQERTK